MKKPRLRKYTKIVQVRLAAETKDDLQWYATKCRETLGKNLRRILQTMAEAIQQVRYQDRGKALQANAQSFCIYLDIKCGDGKNIRSFYSTRCSADPALNEMHKTMMRLEELYGYGMKDEILKIPQKMLDGLSIEQALIGKQFTSINRMLRKWEKEARKFRTKNDPPQSPSQIRTAAAAEGA